MSLTLHSPPSTIHFKDAGVASGAFHMYADAQTLDILQQSAVKGLVLRTFQWDKPTISFGYLLDTERVKTWAASMGESAATIDLVKRPTGGGAVLHRTSDLSFSLAWRRDQAVFSDSPRACYEQIHRRMLHALGEEQLALFAKESGTCEAPPMASASTAGVPVCFNEPVCNDVMRDGKKIIGGALRITKNAILYQGTIQWPAVPIDDLKKAVRGAFV